MPDVDTAERNNGKRCGQHEPSGDFERMFAKRDVHGQAIPLVALKE